MSTPVFLIGWVLVGWLFMLIVIKGHGGLTNMLAEGVGDARKKDVELFSTASPIEKISITRQISKEVEFQKEVGAPRLALIAYCVLLMALYAFLGPVGFIGLFAL